VVVVAVLIVVVLAVLAYRELRSRNTSNQLDVPWPRPSSDEDAGPEDDA
jgi:hypothetical protein